MVKLNRLKRYLRDNESLYLFIMLVRYFMEWILSIPRVLRNIFYCIAYYRTLKVLTCNHITMDIKEFCKIRAHLPHPIGIVIGAYVKFGNGCHIYQNVTIGAKESGDIKYPVIGDNVIIYANSVIFGNIKIGNNVIIGAGSVINTDIPDNCVVAGNPVKIIKYK